MSVLKIKDQNGQWTDVLSIKGEKGDNGQDYVLTEQDKQEIAGLVDVPVDDVQIDGTSIVNNGVASIPIGTGTALGVVKGWPGGGTQILADGRIATNQANVGEIKAGTINYKPITPANQYASIFYGLAKSAGDTTQSASSNAIGTYTDEAKSAIQTMLDVPSKNDIPEVNVDDVQINGASIVSNGVAEIPLMSATQIGVAKTRAAGGRGIFVYSGEIMTQKPDSTTIKSGIHQYQPIVPYNQHQSVFYGLAKAAGSDEKNSTLPIGQYTDEAKSAIQGMIGVGDFEIIKTVELTEDSEIIEIDTDEAGNPFKLTEMAFLMNASPSTATTANTNAYIKNRHTTYCATVLGVVRPSATVFFGSIKNIFVSESNNDANFVILNISNSQPSYWNLKHPTGNEKNYSEYFAVYTTGTSKFGAGTKITLLGRKK